MFPVMAGDAHIGPVLQLCLASLAAHATFLRENLTSKHAVFMSYIFRNSGVLDQLATRLNTGESTWMRPTGIPPHVELYRQHVETRKALTELPTVLLDGFSNLLDDKCVTQHSITRDNLGATIRSILEEAGLWQSHTTLLQAETSSDPTSIAHHWQSDGKFHRMPEAFIFPQLDALSVWRLWWLGNPAAGYPPFRRLQPSDFTKANRKMFSEWTVLVCHIVAGVERA
eukprot:jgi/Phyca11/41572/gw1.247.4.1